MPPTSSSVIRRSAARIATTMASATACGRKQPLHRRERVADRRSRTEGDPAEVGEEVERDSVAQGGQEDPTDVVPADPHRPGNYPQECDGTRNERGDQSVSGEANHLDEQHHHQRTDVDAPLGALRRESRCPRRRARTAGGQRRLDRRASGGRTARQAKEDRDRNIGESRGRQHLNCRRDRNQGRGGPARLLASVGSGSERER